MLIISCSSRNKLNNKQNCLTIAKEQFKKKGYKLNNYRIEESEDTSYYKVEFLLKDTLIDGGGAFFKILKRNCRIVERKYYQ